MVDTTQQKGLSTELHCILDFTDLGYRCLTPVDDSSKYDVVVDLGERFLKIQCKTSSWVADTAQEHVAFAIRTEHQTTNTKRQLIINIQRKMLIIFILGSMVKDI